MAEHIYELKTAFSYAFKGESVDASFISLTAPTFKHIDKVAPIKQAFTLAISEISSGSNVDTEDKEAEEEKKITGGECMQIFYRSTVDITKVMLHAEQLFKSGVAMVDGEVKLTTPLMEKMSLDDFEGLVGAYVANFIMPSLMDGT